LESENLSNNEFEDRVAALLTALGFCVDQQGYKLKGAYPDGVAIFDGKYAIVYDCKNKKDFYPTEEDKRALYDYLMKEKLVNEDKEHFCAFIAKSFAGEKEEKNIFYFSVEDLLYLLYKKLILGPKFSLSPLKKILYEKMTVNKETIDNEWRNKCCLIIEY